MDDNVIVVQFDEPSKAYQALSELKHLGDEGRVEVQSAVLLERNVDGSVRVPEGADNAAGMYVLGGSLIGMIVGALAGPVGLLLGASFGALGGSAGEFVRAGDDDVALEGIGARIVPGSPALVAEVSEAAVEVVDNAMAALGGTVTRRAASDVYAEVVAAEDAQDHEDVEAVKARAREHRADRKAKWESFKQNVKAKVS
jgi:uncharacterized membrane protein